MLCTSPAPPGSPAGSEISVGAPSPPPQTQQQQQQSQDEQLHLLQTERRRGGEDYFRPLKRLKGITRERSASPPSRSSLEGVKSFSIADILGHDSRSNDSTSTLNIQQPPQLNHHHHHQSSTKIVRPWDHLRSSVHAVRPFLPPALLHYEHRLALDYHRHLEHLNAQAQLLRHMNMNMSMDIIPSESGSERSSSAASDCCSPEIGSSGSRLSEHNHHLHHSSTQQQQTSPSSHHHNHTSGNGGNSSGQKTKPNGTPLDALFQMTNKSFDETQGNDNISGIFIVLFACVMRMLYVERDYS